MSSRFPPRGFPGRRVPPSRVAEPASLFGEGPLERALTVSAFVAGMNGTLRMAHPDTWVRGEVGDFKVWSSGHAYFTLKDDAATLNAMMWAGDVQRLRFRVDAGLEVLARGRPDIYARSGKLSFVVSELEPAGAGALQLAFEQLKARLLAEGLFDPGRKRPLPMLPARIGVVTSRQGAALRDILKVLGARFPNAHVTIYPVAVQGTGAAEEIARAVNAFSRVNGADVVIVARGGGSREDLASFNEEVVVRAVAASSIPTISAVGHEVDVTLTDLAADVRAATPSQAAELVVARREDFEARLAGRQKEMAGLLKARLQDARAALMALSAAPGLGGFAARVARTRFEAGAAHRALVASVRSLPSVFGQRLAAAEESLRSWPARAALPHLRERVGQEIRALLDRLAARLASARERLGIAAGSLGALDPLRVLARGYAVAYKEGEPAPLTSAGSVAPGDRLRVLLARGEIGALVTDVGNDEERTRRGNREEVER